MDSKTPGIICLNSNIIFYSFLQERIKIFYHKLMSFLSLIYILKCTWYNFYRGVIMKKIIKLLLFFLCCFLSINNAVLAVPGCCSWHGGEVGCRGGKTLCSDGTISSCPCDGTNSSLSSSGKYNGVDNNSNDPFAILCSIIIVFSGFFVFMCIINLYEKNSINRHKKMSEKKY